MAQSAKTTAKNGKTSLSETWSTLKSAWKSYKVARMNSDKVKMIECAQRIRGLQQDLGAKQSEFPELNIH